MRLLTTFARGAGLALCTVAFAGPALANPGNGNANGNGGTPPGQEQKAEHQPATPAAAAPGQAKQAEPKAQAKAEPKAQARAEAKAQAKAESKARAKVQAKAASKAHAKTEAKAESKAKGRAEAKPSAAKGRSAEAHHHVIICHRTGSDSNPYVVINIPWTAWSEAHSPDTGSHPDLNGRHDILLKDPASRPGSKDGFTKSACGSTTPAVTTTPPVVTTTPPAVTPTKHTDVCPNIEGMQKTVPAGHVVDEHGNCIVSAGAVSPPKSGSGKGNGKAAPIAAQTPAGGVLGAATPAQGREEEGEEPAGGVLGEIASAPEAITETATTGTLPFTGLPLWIAALLGLALLATGLALRRAGQH